jgi:hypothetical protein
VSSTKQKLNTRSSTETEIVGADDFMPAICWTRYFMEAQGYQVKDNVLFQDNKSAILLEKNGKASSSKRKRTKHISIRYFFITDRVKKGDVLLVAWCPTGDMIADYMTKPLQGALFRKFRDQIMGVVPARDPGPGKVKPGNSILHTHKVTPKEGATAKHVRFTDSELDTHKVKAKVEPTKSKHSTRKSLVPPGARNHRSVLELVAKRTKDGHGKTGCRASENSG